MAQLRHHATRAALEKEIEEYVSDRSRGREAYEFNIKIHKIDLPDGARRQWSEDQIAAVVTGFMQSYLKAFAEQLKFDFTWIFDWSQEGRSGGWLVLKPAYGLVGQDAGIQTLRQRVKDLHAIEKRVKRGIREVVETLESREYWEVRKQDWSPRD